MQRNYYKGGFFLCYQESTSWLFGNKPAKYYYGLLYEENGKFYEFLTEQFMGVLVKGNGRYDYYKIHSEIYGDDIYMGGSCSSYCRLFPVSAEAFAREAKEYMQHKDKIVRLINQELEKRKKHYAKILAEQKRIAAEQAAKAREDKENTAWLEQQFKNRRH